MGLWRRGQSPGARSVQENFDNGHGSSIGFDSKADRQRRGEGNPSSRIARFTLVVGVVTELVVDVVAGGGEG